MANEDRIEVEYNRKLGLARGVISGRFTITVTIMALAVCIIAFVYWSGHA